MKRTIIALASFSAMGFLVAGILLSSRSHHLVTVKTQARLINPALHDVARVDEWSLDGQRGWLVMFSEDFDVELLQLLPKSQPLMLCFEGKAVNDETVMRLAPFDVRGISFKKTDVNPSAFRYLTDSPRLSIVYLTGMNLRDCDLSSLARCISLRELYLETTKLNGNELASLAGLPNLEILDCNDNPDLDTLDGIAHCSRLKRLRLYLTGVTDTALEQISCLKSLEVLDISATKATGAALQSIAKLPCIREVNISGLKVTDEEWKALGKIKSLEVLRHSKNLQDSDLESLAGSRLRRLDLLKENITDKGMVYVGTLNYLEKLELSNTGVTDKGLVHLRTLQNLYRLSLNGNPGVTDKGLVHLWFLRNLESLSLDDTQVTSRGIKNLCNCDKLNGLSLDNTMIDDSCIKDLGKLPLLKFLRLDGTKITDAAIDGLVVMDNLSSISLERCNLSDAGALKLLAKQTLYYLNLKETHVSKKTIKKLQDQFPNAAIKPEWKEHHGIPGEEFFGSCAG